MSVSVALPKNHPVLLAYKAYRETEEYANTRKWAQNETHVDGSLWAAFEAGYRASTTECQREKTGLREAVSAKVEAFIQRYADCETCPSTDDIADYVRSVLDPFDALNSEGA